MYLGAAELAGLIEDIVNDLVFGVESVVDVVVAQLVLGVLSDRENGRSIDRALVTLGLHLMD